MGKIHENYCVAFVDILGFKSLTYALDNSKCSEIDSALEIMRSHKLKEKQFENLRKDTHIISMQVSDSLIFLFPKTFANLYIVIRCLAVMQFQMAMQGIYVRGSVNSGLMYVDEDKQIYYGEAWNKAVVSEETAVTPRILLESSLADFLTRYLRETFNEGVTEFFRDEDGNFSLSSYDWYNALNLQIGETAGQSYLGMLNELERNVVRNSQNKGVLRKYLWINNKIRILKFKGTVFDEVRKQADKINSLIESYLDKN